MRVAFFGSPAFAVPCLEAVHEIADVVAVYSQPDRPSGRGLTLRPPAVKARALELGLDVFQPTKVRNGTLEKQLIDLELDVAVVVAYGRILPLGVLEAPRRGCVNVHGSLLPRWRGAAPIQWAIASLDTTTGVTLMQMDEGMDTGPMIATSEVTIGEGETTPELAERLSAEGARLLREVLPSWVDGTASASMQPEGATHASMLDKTHGHVDWTMSAAAIDARRRAFTPWPGTSALAGDTRWKLHQTRVLRVDGVQGDPGQILDVADGAIAVACGTGSLAIDVLQEPGKKRLAAEQFAAGRSLPERLQ